MNNTKATVIIPTKNPGPIFTKVLDKVLSQETLFSYEVLIIDSGSTDGTIDQIRKTNDVKLRLHQIAPHEYGHGRTRNLGISMSRSEFAALITHDALPTDTLWLQGLVSAAEQDAEIAGVFGRHIAYPQANPFTANELNLHFQGFEREPVVKLDDPSRYECDQGYRQYLHFFSDNNALIRRSVWEQIPYSDVDFAEDQLWAKQIIEAGYKKAYSKVATVYHSHDYRLFERLQRSFDEAYAFNRFFGYTICPNLKASIKMMLGLMVRDLKLAKNNNIWKTDFSQAIKMPPEHIMRCLGYYLGTKGKNLPQRLIEHLSWDNKLFTGERKNSGN